MPYAYPYSPGVVPGEGTIVVPPFSGTGYYHPRANISAIQRYWGDGVAMLLPMTFNQTMNVTKFALRFRNVSNSGVWNGGRIRFYIYDDVDGKPANLEVDGGTADLTPAFTSATITKAISNFQMQGGHRYWVGVMLAPLDGSGNVNYMLGGDYADIALAVPAGTDPLASIPVPAADFSFVYKGFAGYYSDELANTGVANTPPTTLNPNQVFPYHTAPVVWLEGTPA